MHITIIGTINRDTIHPFRGPRIDSYGGILYNLVALSVLMGRRATLHPVCNVGADIQHPVISRLQTFPNIDLHGIRPVAQQNNHAVLTYTTPDDREEILEHRLPPLTFRQVRPFLESDLILVNFISGFELSLATLKNIRRAFPGLIYVDVHSLTLDLDHDGRRRPRRPTRWTEWIGQTDICQLNFDECQTVAGRLFDGDGETAGYASRLLDMGPSTVLVTLGPRGSLVVYRRGSRILQKRSAAPRVRSADTTGCGDVFSAGFISEYLRSEDPVAANRLANRAAALNCTLRGLDELHHIAERLSEADGGNSRAD